jgi:nucleotide-binding universal stress UspA family protein
MVNIRRMTTKRILVPVDFSILSPVTVEYAVLIAGGLGASVTFLHVYEPPDAMSAIVPGANASQDLDAERVAALKNMDVLIHEASFGDRISFTTSVEVGYPTACILERVRTDSIDLVVMGTHGRNGIDRLQALVRRASQGHGGPTTLTFHELSLDLLTRRVTRDGREIDLQAKEFALMEYLMRNSGRVLSKTMILQQIWGYDFDPQTNVVDVLVCRLRNKIDRDFAAKYIQTLRGVGYVLRQD